MRPTLARLAALVVLFVLAAGCRDVLVDPQPVPQAPDAPNGVATLYLKGPTRLGTSVSANYRAQFADGVSHYEWRAVGDGAVSIGFPSGDTRLPVITGVNVGNVDLIAEAYSADGRLLGVAFKAVTVH